MLSGARGPRWDGPRLLLLFTLTLGAGASAAQDAPIAAGGGVTERADARDAGVNLRAQVEDLTQRIQGVEGKLRESAVARKVADQARMEAERRLAEGTQELGRLRVEVGLLQDAKLALEVRLRRAEERAEITAQGLVAAEELVRRLTAERDAQAAERLPQLTELQRQIEGASRERSRTQTQEELDLRRSLSERESELKRVQLELRVTQAERDALSRRLAALSVTSPDPEGGGTSLEEAQAQAGAAADALRVALAQVQGSRDAASRRAVREAAQDLHRRQFRVARLLGARSVYRVGPGDSFVRIAGRFYGDGRRWPEIQEANLRVVPDPSHLVPGLTLVIP